MDYIYNPVVTSAVVAIVLTVGIAFLLIRSAANIGKGIKWLFKKILTMQAFFWLVNIICMAFSAQNAGYFFGLYEPIGLAVAFVLDLMIIAFTSAMLSARAQGDEKRARLILCFIFLCAFLSTVGNLVHNLQTQQLVNDKVNHVWFQQVLPYVASCIPLFLVLLAFVADLVTKVNLEKVDVAEFEAMERKRAEIMEKRNEYMDRQLKAEERFRALLSQKKANKRQGTIRDFRWPWEPRISVQQIATQVQANTQSSVEALQQQLTVFIQQTQSAHIQLTALVEKQAQKVAVIEQQKDVDNNLIVAEFQKFQNTVLEEVRTLLEENSVQESVTPKDANVSLMDEISEYFSDNQSVQDCDTDGLSIVNTEDNTSLYTDTDPELPTPINTKRHTQPLPELHTNAATKTTRQTSAKSDTKNTRGDAYKRAMRVLKRNPDIKPGELAEKAKISRTYATRILTEKPA